MSAHELTWGDLIRAPATKKMPIRGRAARYLEPPVFLLPLTAGSLGAHAHH